MHSISLNHILLHAIISAAVPFSCFTDSGPESRVKGVDRSRTHADMLISSVFCVCVFAFVCLCLCSDGRSRCFGFVGFSTDKDAVKAKRNFNDTFIDTSKIIIEFAKPVRESRSLHLSGCHESRNIPHHHAIVCAENERGKQNCGLCGVNAVK